MLEFYQLFSATTVPPGNDILVIKDIEIYRSESVLYIIIVNDFQPFQNGVISAAFALPCMAMPRNP
jgi:hypothetical protein